MIKVVWGRHWDPLLDKDKTGALKAVMEEAVDGDYQRYQVKGGAYARAQFFGKYPEAEELVKDLSDEDIDNLNRGGHYPYKVFCCLCRSMYGQRLADRNSGENRERLWFVRGNRSSQQNSPNQEDANQFFEICA